MPRKEAINLLTQVNKILVNSNSWLENTHEPLNMAFDMAIKALEKQEPQEVIYSGDGYADGYMVYDMAECPSCGYEYEDSDKDWGESFCPHCGQSLKWEE